MTQKLAKVNNGCPDVPSFFERAVVLLPFYPQLLFAPGTINNF